MSDNTARDLDHGLATLVREAADDFVALLKSQLRLARLEMVRDVRAIGRETAARLAFLPLLVVGYALLMIGIAIGAGAWLGAAGGFVVVGLLNGLVGLFGVAGVFGAARRPPHVLERSRDELDRTLEDVSAVVSAEQPARLEGEAR